MMIKEFEGLNEEILLKKANELKGTDAEGWAIGNLVEMIVKNCFIPFVTNRRELLIDFFRLVCVMHLQSWTDEDIENEVDEYLEKIN